jgi:HK97 family phage major capsid protein
LTNTATAIKESLDNIQNTTLERFEDHARTIKALETRTDRLEAFTKRPGLLPSHDNDNHNLKAERDAVAHFLRHGSDAKLREVQASMSVGSDPDGGYFSLPSFSQGITKKLFDATPMRQLARVVNVPSGSDWIEPIDNSDIGASWVGEQQSRPATATPQLGELKVPLDELYALQPVTQKLLDDSTFDLGGFVQDKITDKFIRAEGTAFVSGDGVGKPRGFLSYNVVATKDASRKWGDLQYLPTGSASAITSDSLKDCVWGLRTPYRAGSAWVMNSTTAGVVDKLKDGQGNYLWRESYVAGVPPTLLGYPIYICEDMPDIAGNSTPIAFGNFKLGYVIIDRPGLRLIVDNLTSKPLVQFYAYRRVGGGVANSEAIKLVKIATS